MHQTDDEVMYSVVAHRACQYKRLFTEKRDREPPNSLFTGNRALFNTIGPIGIGGRNSLAFGTEHQPFIHKISKSHAGTVVTDDQESFAVFSEIFEVVDCNAIGISIVGILE